MAVGSDVRSSTMQDVCSSGAAPACRRRRRFDETIARSRWPRRRSLGPLASRAARCSRAVALRGS